MIRVTPTKLQLKAEDSLEYERHKASWSKTGKGQDSNGGEKTQQQEDPSYVRNAVRARLGVTSATAPK